MHGSEGGETRTNSCGSLPLFRVTFTSFLFFNRSYQSGERKKVDDSRSLSSFTWVCSTANGRTEFRSLLAEAIRLSRFRLNVRFLLFFFSYFLSSFSLSSLLKRHLSSSWFSSSSSQSSSFLSLHSSLPHPLLFSPPPPLVFLIRIFFFLLLAILFFSVPLSWRLLLFHSFVSLNIDLHTSTGTSL